MLPWFHLTSTRIQTGNKLPFMMSLIRVMPAMFWRGISTSGSLGNIKAIVSARQQAKMMNKFLAAAKKKERQLLTPLSVDGSEGAEADAGVGAGSVRVRPLRAASAKHRHRLEALSAIYLARVTELLSTGEVLPGLLDDGVLISKVQLSGNMRLVYVFWTAPASADERALAERLEASSRDVRDALTQQRVTGHVPGVKFVRDSDNTALLEVERQLALADFGPDFVPTDPTHFVKRQGVLGRPLSTSHTADLLSGNRAPAAGPGEPEPPEMPHSTGGLNHAAILAEVQRRIQRSTAPHRQVAVYPEAVTPAPPPAPGSELDEQASFARFTRQQKWARLRRGRVKKSVSVDEWAFLNRQDGEEDVDAEDPAEMLPEDREDMDLTGEQPTRW
ncbi:uncharacterized protein LOC119097116 [Pollicipes pollicipes]|uniref:uncharacterized protein LOC119097116 n=1 Tax=Pollicipes pollicipes TaxID=41117 RepID=UPI001885312B|nr:uncharacterized protein LOC119097116 [Pollicipes pollicipes]